MRDDRLDMNDTSFIGHMGGSGLTLYTNYHLFLKLAHQSNAWISNKGKGAKQ